MSCSHLLIVIDWFTSNDSINIVLVGECDCLHYGDTEDSRDNDKMMYDDGGGWLEECVQCDSDRECQGMWYQCLCQLHPTSKGGV